MTFRAPTYRVQRYDTITRAWYTLRRGIKTLADAQQNAAVYATGHRVRIVNEETCRAVAGSDTGAGVGA